MAGITKEQDPRERTCQDWLGSFPSHANLPNNGTQFDLINIWNRARLASIPSKKELPVHQEKK